MSPFLTPNPINDRCLSPSRERLEVPPHTRLPLGVASVQHQDRGTVLRVSDSVIPYNPEISARAAETPAVPTCTCGRHIDSQGARLELQVPWNLCPQSAFHLHPRYVARNHVIFLAHRTHHSRYCFLSQECFMWPYHAQVTRRPFSPVFWTRQASRWTSCCARTSCRSLIALA